MSLTTTPDIADLAPADKARLKWLLLSRPDQLTPTDKDWLFWLILAGRGWGKTRVGAEDCADWCHRHPKHRFGVVAPTLGNGKKVCFEGDSGLLSVLPEGTYKYNRADLVITLDNGCRIDLYSADQPERLRGPQHHRMWFEELAAWGPKMKEVWDMAMFGLRLPLADGSPNQAVITTTPKPLALLRDLAHRDTVHITRGNTFDNAKNLSAATLDELRRAYEGTRLGEQELYGVLLDDIEGAVWSVMMIENDRIKGDELLELDLDIFDRICVSIDPAMTNNEGSDETGIIVAGRTYLCPCGRATEDEPHMIVLEDGSGSMSSHEWTDRAVALAEKYAAEDIVAEVNNGGDLVEQVLLGASARQKLSQGVRYRPVRASRGKRTRAEPVGALYEKHRVHHWGYFGKLEDQMCGWTGMPSEKSPDRVDALVWNATHLLLPQPRKRGGLRS
jgi:phage terminase large subunit-like protein